MFSVVFTAVLGTLAMLSFPQQLTVIIAQFTTITVFTAKDFSSAGWLMLAVITWIVCSSVRHYLLMKQNQLFVAQLRTQLYSAWIHRQHLTPREEGDRNIVSRFLNDIHTLQSSLGPTFSLLIVNGVQICGALIYMALMNVPLLLLLIVMIVCVGAVFVFSEVRLQRMADTLLAANSRMYDLALEVLPEVVTVKQFAQESHEIKLFEILQNEVVHAGLSRQKFQVSANIIVMSIAFCSLLLLSITGLQLFGGQSHPANSVFSFLMYAVMFINGFIGCMDALSSLGQAATPYQNIINEIEINIDNHQQRASVTNSVIPKVHRIDFINVSANYSIDGMTKEILFNLNFCVVAGETLAIVGESGSGKSTLLKILCKMVIPTRGVVLIDGRDLTQMNTEEVSRIFCYVSHSPFLFTRSVFDNVCYASPSCPSDLMWQSLKTAAGDAFVKNLTHADSTVLDGKGAALSAGQKQRIAIARAIFSARPVLLLDEATSTLDSQTEAAITQSLALNRKEKINIVVSHRLSSVRSADRIIVIEDGRIVQSGSHFELIQTNGAYSEIFQDQMHRLGECI